MELTNISTIRNLMEKHGMNFSKSLGQNFLINPSVSPRIAELGGAEENVGALEIGPGIGVLTKELATRCKKVVAVELDKSLLPILDETLADFDNIKIINADVLDLDLNKIIKEEFQGMDVVVCANLPYYITSPIIMKLLEEKLPIKSITAMVQKEAADRICAPMPSREMGTITVSVGYYASSEVLFSVSKGSFMPAPNVQSSVIKLNVRPQPAVEVLDESSFFAVIKAAFAQRRKTVVNSLSSALQIKKSDMNGIMESSGVSPQLRAEQLKLEDFASIADAYYKFENLDA